MHKKDCLQVTNPVLREALARVEQSNRCAFPYWGNYYGNWANWSNWSNWGNYWRNGW